MSDNRTLASEEVGQIATMQSAQAKMLEYLYQFTIAEVTQSRLDEIEHTIFVTFWSTAILLGISAVNSFVSGAVSGGLAKGLTSLGTEAVKSLYRIPSEILQELYIDPYIENFVSKTVERAGGSFWEQVLWSSLAEGARETLAGSVFNAFKSSMQQSSVDNIQDYRHLSRIMDRSSIEADIRTHVDVMKTQMESTSLKDTGGELVISTMMLFSGCLMGTFVPVTLIGSFSPVVKVMVSNRINKDSIKSVLEKTVDIQEGLVPQPLVPWHFEYSDPTQAVWYHDLGQSLMKETRALSLPQKTVITQDMLDKLKALGLQSLVEKMALEQGLPLHLIGDFPNYQVRSPNNLLTSEQISKYSEFYQRKVERMCVKYALNFKKIIVEEYGQNILSLSKIPLSSHFGFRLDKYIRKVTHLKRDRALGIGILDRVKTHITHKYNRLKKVEAIKQISFKKVISFLKFYREFSEYVSSKTGKGQFSISNIKYMEDTMELAPKSWLFENIRYMFPKRFGLPLRDDLLSWFLFGDTPSHGRVCKLKWTTEGKELLKRMHLTELLSIDYRVSKLSIDDFKDNGIEITGNRLDKLQKGVSYIIYYYIFGGYHESTYVSPTTDKGINVGMEYFFLEYELIRAAFFAAAEINNGIPLNLEQINDAADVTDLKAHLRQGYGFGDDFFKLYDYVRDLLEQRPPNSDRQFLQDSMDMFDAYGDKYEAREQELLKDLGYKSFFQRDVHLFVNDLFGVDFISEKQVRSAVGVREITTINDEGDLETIDVHGQFAFDTYLELNRALKEYLGLDQKWIGIAVEAMGSYWHSDAFPGQQEADRKKKLICKEMNVLLLEIWDNVKQDNWLSELIRQFEDKAGIKLTKEQFSDLRRYIGNLL